MTGGDRIVIDDPHGIGTPEALAQHRRMFEEALDGIDMAREPVIIMTRLFEDDPFSAVDLLLADMIAPPRYLILGDDRFLDLHAPPVTRLSTMRHVDTPKPLGKRARRRMKGKRP